MALQTINIGTSANKGDGDPIRTAFTKVNANFTELYAKVVVLEGGSIALTDLSVGAEGTASGDGAIAYNNVTGVFTYTPPDTSSFLTSVPAQTFASLTGTPTTLAGYGITDAATSAQGTLAASALQVETITLTTLKTEVAASTDFADFQTRVAAL